MIKTRAIEVKNFDYLDNLQVKKAEYLNDYKLRISFSDGKEKVVDFSNYILNTNKAYLSKYKNPAYFKKFKIDHGNIVWGKDWDLIFPIQQLYEGNII